MSLQNPPFVRRSLLRTAGMGALAAAAAVLVLLAAFAATPAAANDRSDDPIAADELDAMGAYFEAHPELKTTPGSGWNPYNRIRWYMESRRGLNGELPEPGARVRAWEHRRRLEEEFAANRTGNTWFNLGPENFAGRILALDFDPVDPNIMYAGAASGGVWKSTDGGTSWTAISDELPVIAVGGLAVSKVDHNVIVIGTGEASPNIDRVTGIGIWRSTDAGASWEPTNVSYNAGGLTGFHFVEAGPNGTFLAGETDGLWRSSDHGASWDTVRVGGDYYDAVWKPGDADRVYTVKGNDASGNNVKVSTDDGLTWTKAGTGQPNSFQIGKTKLAVSAAASSTVYAFIGENGTGGGTTGVYRSQDDGATWTARNTGTNLVNGQSWYNLVCEADPDNVDRLFIGGVILRRSIDGGASWTTIGGGVHADHHDLKYIPGSTSTLWVGNDGGVWRSGNDGTSWTNMNNGLITYQFYDICVNNNNSTAYYVMGGTQDNGTDKWSGSVNWLDGLGGDGMVCNIDPVNGTTVYAERQNGSHQKNFTSGSGSWSAINGGLTGSGAWVAPVDQDQNDVNHLYTATSDGIFRTTTGGSGWTNVAPQGATWISISPVDGDIVWTALGGGAPWYTTDDGGSWNQASPYGFLTGTATKIHAHPTNPSAALVVFGGYAAGIGHVAYTTDLGATWSDGTGNLGDEPVNAAVIDPSNPDDWYIGTDTGAWYSTDHGAQWIPYMTGLPNVVVSDLEIQDQLRKLVAGTHGRGAWEIEIPPKGANDVAVDSGPRSRNLMLDAPFPNPITDRTTLRFAARHDGPVTVDIYDVTGRHVINLAELAQGDGVIRTTPWLPDGAPSGVYFAVLRAGEESLSRKLVVLE